VTALDQLKRMASKKQYRESAELLQALLGLLVHFKNFRNIKQVSDLCNSVTGVQSDLKAQVFKEYEDA